MAGILNLLDVTLSVQGATAWEIALGTNIQIMARTWYANFISRFGDGGDAGGALESDTNFRYLVTNVRGDSTNSSTLHGMKVHTCEVVSVRSGSDADCDDERCGGRRELTSYPDTLFVPSSNTAERIRELYVKHARSIGAPLPGDLGDSDGEDDTSLNIEVDGSARVCRRACRSAVVKVWVFTTDAGGDEAAAVNFLCDGATEVDNHLAGKQKCLLHQFQLIIKRVLVSLRQLNTMSSCLATLLIKTPDVLPSRACHVFLFVAVAVVLLSWSREERRDASNCLTRRLCADAFAYSTCR